MFKNLSGYPSKTYLVKYRKKYHDNPDFHKGFKHPLRNFKYKDIFIYDCLTPRTDRLNVGLIWKGLTANEAFSMIKNPPKKVYLK